MYSGSDDGYWYSDDEYSDEEREHAAQHGQRQEEPYYEYYRQPIGPDRPTYDALVELTSTRPLSQHARIVLRDVANLTNILRGQNGLTLGGLSTYLIIAVAHDNLQMMRDLITVGADVNLTVEDSAAYAARTLKAALAHYAQLVGDFKAGRVEIGYLRKRPPEQWEAFFTSSKNEITRRNKDTAQLCWPTSALEQAIASDNLGAAHILLANHAGFTDAMLKRRQLSPQFQQLHEQSAHISAYLQILDSGKCPTENLKAMLEKFVGTRTGEGVWGMAKELFTGAHDESSVAKHIQKLLNNDSLWKREFTAVYEVFNKTVQYGGEALFTKEDKLEIGAMQIVIKERIVPAAARYANHANATTSSATAHRTTDAYDAKVTAQALAAQAAAATPAPASTSKPATSMTSTGS